jgi:hypothetical protein
MYMVVWRYHAFVTIRNSSALADEVKYQKVLTQVTGWHGYIIYLVDILADLNDYGWHGYIIYLKGIVPRDFVVYFLVSFERSEVSTCTECVLCVVTVELPREDYA